MSGLFSGLTSAYTRAYARRPVLTLSLTNGALTSVSDLVAQGIEGNKARQSGKEWKYDPIRTIRFAAFGTAMGPIIGKWLSLLDTKFPLTAGMSKGKQAGQLAKRVLADQAVAAPVGLALFTGGMSLMEGKNSEEVKEKFGQMYKKALVTNWQVWPAIQAVNFTVVPLQFRLGFQQTCGILWTCYLSMLNQRADESVAAANAQGTTAGSGKTTSTPGGKERDRYTFEDAGSKMKVIQDEGPTKTYA